MNLHDVVEFHISGPKGNFQARPANSSIELEKKFDEDICALRHYLKTELNFCEDDFVNLMEYENESDVCSEVLLTLKAWCDDSLVDIWSGVLNFNETTVDCDTCTITIKIDPKDGFSCITDNWKNKKNYLDITDRVTVDTVKGEIICETIESTNTEPVPPAGFGWVLTNSSYEYFVPPIPYSLIPIKYIYEFCRTCRDTPLDGWVEEDGKYYNTPQLNGCVTNYEVGLEALNIELGVRGRFYTRTTKCSIIDLRSSTGIALTDWLNFYNPDCCFKSNLFGINPDGTAPNNIAYQFGSMYLHNLVLFNGSDIAIATNAEAAFNSDTTDNGAGDLAFFKWWKDFKKKYNLELILDPADGCIRIEHISYRRNRPIFNLIKHEDGCFLEGKNKYKKTETDFPSSESFSYSVESQRDWDAGLIEYGSNCSNGEESECTLDVIHTNVAYFFDREESFDDVKDLVFMLSLDQDGNVNTIGGAFTGEPIFNGPLSWPLIIENLHLWDRPFKNGTMNDRVYNFFTTKKNKSQTGLSGKLKCSDWINYICERPLIKTMIGKKPSLGEIETAQYSIPARQVSFDVRHE